MDFYQMEQILAVARTGSISEAARQMCVSQPTMSHAVARAEKEFQTKLFNRGSYPLELTYAGKQYVEAAREMRRIYRNLQKVCMDAARGYAGDLYIGIPHNRSAQILPRIIREYRRMFPNIKLHYSSTNAEDMKEQLYRGELDLCILSKVDQDPRFRYEDLFVEELVAAAADGLVRPDQLCGKNASALKIEALSQLPLILPSERSGLGRMLQILLEYYHIDPDVRMRVGGNNALYTLAGAGVGVAVLPMDTVEQSARPEGLKTYALSAGGIGWMVCAMLGRDAVVSEPERALLELIRREFGGKETEVEVFPGFYEGEK